MSKHSIILDKAVNSFLKSFYPELSRPYLRGAAKWIETQHPQVWREFVQFVCKRYNRAAWLDTVKPL